MENNFRQEIEAFIKENDFGYENLKNFTYIDCVLNKSHYGPVNQIITHSQVHPGL